MPNAASIGRYQSQFGKFYLEGKQEYDWQNIFDFIVPGTNPTAMLPFSGDWNGIGLDTVGLFDPFFSAFYLKYANDPGPFDFGVQYGPPNQGWLPIVGDFDGTGKTTIGLYKQSTSEFFLKKTNTSGDADFHFWFGPPGQLWIPIAGDWTGKGYATVGLFNPESAHFYLRNVHDGGPSDIDFAFGSAGAGQTPLAGDWDGNGVSTVGLYHPYEFNPNPGQQANCYYPFFLKHDNSASNANTMRQTSLRAQGFTPVAGRWKPSANAPSGNTTPPYPSWAKDLVIYNLRVDTYTPKRTFVGVTEKLDHIASVASAIWLNPITPTPHKPNYVEDVYYDVLDHTKVDPILGTETEFKTLVDAAHAKGLKIFIDVMPHGINKISELVQQHPDWFVKDREGRYVSPWANQYELMHALPEVAQWWQDVMIRDWVMKYSIDGFRCDLEPGPTGFTSWCRVRERAAAMGKEVFIFSEGKTNGMNWCYHMNQESTGLGWNSAYAVDFMAGNVKVADFVKDLGNVETFYPATLSMHDRKTYQIQGRLAYAAYGAFYGPFVPIFFAGEEWNATQNMPLPDYPLYFTRPDWNELNDPTKAAFLRRWQAMHQTRRSLRTTFAPFDHQLNQTRCVTLASQGSELSTYGLTSDNNAVIVTARKDEPTVAVGVDLGLLGTINVSTPTNDVALRVI